MGFGGTGGFGGATSGGSGSGGVVLSSILYPMLRIAGITTLPGTTPNDDQIAEIIPMVNRMLGSFSLDGHKIYNSAITPFNLTSGQKEYTIGPGGELDMARPLYIKYANVILPTDPQVRWPMAVLDDQEWADVTIQDIGGAPPYALYYDNAMDENGQGTLSLIFQPPADYILELYTWQQLQSNFTDKSDVAIFPPGYEEMIVQCGAERVVGMYPLESKLDANQRAALKTLAGQALRAVKGLNTKSPKLVTEAGLGNDNFATADNGRGWLSGPFR